MFISQCSVISGPRGGQSSDLTWPEAVAEGTCMILAMSSLVFSLLILCNSAISCEGENLCCSSFFVNSSLKSMHVQLRQNVVTNIMVVLNLDVLRVEGVFLLRSFVLLLSLLFLVHCKHTCYM